MSNIRFKNKHNKSGENYKVLCRELNDINNVVQNFIKKLTFRVFSIVKRSVSFKIIMAGGNARLNVYDEKLFLCYSHLISGYKKTIVYYESNKNVNKNIKTKNIIEGINSIMSSRVKQAIETFPKDNENPILVEKRNIMGGCLNTFMKSCEKIQTKYMEQKIVETMSVFKKPIISSFDYDISLKAADYLIDNIEKDCLTHMYPMYMDASRLFVSSLNHIGGRDETKYYLELIRKDHEILSSIIKIQIHALENEMSSSLVSSEERDFIDKYLVHLKESYQYFAKEATELISYFDGAMKKSPEVFFETIEDFVKDVKEQINRKDVFPTQIFEESKIDFSRNFEKLYSSIKVVIKETLNSEISKYNYKQNIYEFQKQIVNATMLAEEIENVFKDIYTYFDKNKESLLLEEPAPIIKGVDETISIKIENIQDNKGELLLNWSELLKKFQNEKIGFTQHDETILLDKVFNEFLAEIIMDFLEKPNQTQVKNLIESIFEKCFNNEYRQKFIKTKESQQDSINKMLLSFKKDTLLYEMSTFEEIMNYSVSKLRENSSTEIMSYVGVLDTAFNDLNLILCKNGINPISPKPHEMFNSKEHDVLLAEKTLGFEKGEIVKLMNSGYKEKDVVIIRANVIAAK